MAHDQGSNAIAAIRLRLRVGPRSPVHPLLAALPPDAQARALLRLTEAGAAVPDSAAERSTFVAALIRIAEAMERLAAKEGSATQAAVGKGGSARAAKLNAA